MDYRKVLCAAAVLSVYSTFAHDQVVNPSAYLSTLKELCIKQQMQMPDNASLTITKIDQYCTCFAAQLLKTLTIQEFRDGAGTDAVKNKLAGAGLFCAIEIRDK